MHEEATVERTLESVSKAEFDAFVADYPGGLRAQFCATAEPPVTLYFSTLPDSSSLVPAKIVWYSMMSGHPAYKGEPDEYRIDR